MTTVFTWNISKLDCYPEQDGEQDVVFSAHWQCIGTDGENTASVYSTAAITVDAEEPFTPYQDLTKEQVLGWIWNSGVDKDVTESAVQQQIDNLINPPVVSPALPWATE